MAVRITKFQPDPAGIKAAISSAEAQAAMYKVAQEVAGHIASTTMPHHTGHEAEQVHAGGAGTSDGHAVAYVYTTSPVWHLVEFGSIHNPAYHPFRAALEQLGIPYTDNG